MKKVIAILVTAAAIVGFSANGFLSADDKPPTLSPVVPGTVTPMDKPPTL